MKRYWKYYLIAFLVLALDQAIKLGVHYNMEMGLMGQIKLLGNWFKLFYTLNPGMAFGIEFGFKYDKIVLTVTRIIAIILIGRHVIRLAKDETISSWLLWGWTLILGGACGNAVDSIFYGKLLNNTPYQAPMSWFYGQVIDMFYLDVWSGQLPSWLPYFGGQHIIVFPVFNLADVAILSGVALLVLAKKPLETIQEALDQSDALDHAPGELAHMSEDLKKHAPDELEYTSDEPKHASEGLNHGSDEAMHRSAETKHTPDPDELKGHTPDEPKHTSE